MRDGMFTILISLALLALLGTITQLIWMTTMPTGIALSLTVLFFALILAILCILQ